MKKFTRILATFLSIVMLVSMLPVGTVSASATAQTKSVLSASDEDTENWGVVGNICGTYWDTDFPMREQADGSFLSDVFELHAGEEFKVRQGGAWDVNYGADGVLGGDNIVVETSGQYRVKLTIDGEDVTIELIPGYRYTDITANGTATAEITYGGQLAYFRYVAKKNGKITFYSTGSSDTYGYILDASGDTLRSDDESGDGNNFSISYQVSAGTTYYLAAGFYSSSQTGSFEVCLLVDEPLAITGGLQTYTLFNSGRTDAATRYSSSSNPAADTLTNDGYDIYATTSYSSMRTVQLGLPFTIETAVLEQATLSIYAYDVDESYGERDYIYLYDETTGQSTMLDGYLSGMDNQWNTTVFKIDPSLFEVGHTYHFLLNVYVDSWVVYVRNVSIELPCGGSADERFILSSDFSATIDADGMVSTTLSLATSESSVLSLEYAATYDGIRYGATTETFATTSEPSEKNVSFYLQSGAPKGTYSINVIVKRADGSIVTTFTTVASTVDVCSVGYNANGGSQNLPHDSNAYTAGDTVTVRFDYLPSREGYIFLGWARDRAASVAEFTQDNGASFEIFADTTLYAVWGLEHSQHTPGAFVVDVEPGCVNGGSGHTVCAECGETVDTVYIPATGHSYAYSTTVDPDCEQDGYVLYICGNDDCGAEKRDSLPALGHSYGDDNVCDRCGHTLPYLHEHKYSDIVVAPTCCEMGYTLHTCACGASYRDDYIEPSGHSWDEGTVTNENGCVLDGTMLYTCTVCGQTRTQSIPAAHDWTQILITQATCETDGEMKRVCKRCGEEQLQTIPAGHSWDEGSVIKEPTCSEEGTKECTCTVCGSSEEQTIAALGHEFYCGVCIRCGIKFIDIVNDDLTHLQYGMYFELDDVISAYGPETVNEYGVMLNYNSDAQLDKVAVYLTQDATMWRRCIACTGSGIEFATYVPYLSYHADIKYSGLNCDWINTFSLRPNADGIWNYDDYATIGVNLEDQYGQLLLSLYSIGNAGAQTRVFDDLDEMIAWLSPQTKHEHSAGEWEPAIVVDGKVTQIKCACTQCGETLQYRNVKAEFYTTEVSGRYQDSIRLDIYVKAGSYLSDLQLNFGYNSEMFEVESVEFAAGLPGLQQASIDPDTQRIRLIYSDTVCLSEDTCLASVQLKIKANVVYRTEKAIWLAEDAYNICHALLGNTCYALDVAFESGFGNVSILGIDPNGDGELNIFDLYAMLMALVSPDYAYDDAQLVATMDCNGDGIFDVADLTYLQQMIVDMG